MGEKLANYYKNFFNTFILVVSTVLLGITLLFMKYRVRNLEKELFAVNQNITKNVQKIKLLKTEWSRLNQATRIKNLTGGSMVTLNYNRVITIADIPLKNGVDTVHTVSYKE
jgi:hypothetical protein